jgi:hypothetical protein
MVRRKAVHELLRRGAEEQQQDEPGGCGDM